MTPTDFTQHHATVRDALATFLQTLLGVEAPLQLDAPVSIDAATAGSEAGAYLALYSAGAPAVAVMLDPRWLPTLSQPMLGEAMEVGDDGWEDLVRELSAQAFGGVRTQLNAAGIKLDDVQFDLLPPGSEPPAGRLAEALFQVPFSVKLEAGTLGGFALLPAEADPAPAAAPPAAAPQAAPPAAAGPPVDVARAAFPDLGGEQLGGDGLSGNLTMLSEVEMEVTVELGRRRLPLADLLRLTTGSVIELEKLVGEPLEVYANGRLIAEGEAVVIDEQFGIRVTRLASNRQKRDKVFR